MEKNIYLIGMPGSGKSTIGKDLAQKLGKGFVDFDELIEKTANMSVGQLLSELGENMFLGYEKNLALGLEYSNTVISLSGSVSLVDEVMEFLKKSGPAIYIKTPIETIKKRLPNMKTDRIIGISQNTLDGIYEKRKSQYEKWADFTFENTQDVGPDEVFKNFEIFLSTLPFSSGANNPIQTKPWSSDLSLYSKYKIAGDFIYLSGQIGIYLESQEMIINNLDDEFRQAFKNAKALLLGAGYGMKDVVKTTIYLKDIKNYDLMNEVFNDYFILKPARSVLEVSGLPLGANIMVEVIAYKDPEGRMSAKRDWGPGRGI